MATAQEQPRVVSASREIAAGCAQIFELIADPAQQPRWDGNDNLAEAPAGQREVLEIIDAGSKAARVEAISTMSRVREAVFGWGKKRNELASGGSN